MMTDVPEAADESRDELEREREFLLRSLDDLERERDKGTIDDESYERLHAEYTARAAAVIRALRDGVDARPVASPTSKRRRVLTIAGIVAFAAVVAVALAAALGVRQSGQTSSGNTKQATPSGTISMADRIDRLQRAVAANPDDQASRLLLARFLEAKGDLHGALQQYDEVLARNPANAEAEAQAGRILYLAAQAAVKAEPDQVDSLVQQSRARLDHAVSLDPQYPDARFFRAIVLANEFGDFPAAQNDLQRYLILAPSGVFANDARSLLAEVTNAIDGTPIPTTTPAQGKNDQTKKNK